MITGISMRFRYIDDQTLVSLPYFEVVRIRTDLVTQSEDKTEYRQSIS